MQSDPEEISEVLKPLLFVPFLHKLNKIKTRTERKIYLNSLGAVTNENRKCLHSRSYFDKARENKQIIKVNRTSTTEKKTTTTTTTLP